MKKKILFIILCLLSLTYINGVSARACTQNDIESARATLTVSSAISIPIPSLGRTAPNKANLYKMYLTHRSSGQQVNSFCLDSPLSATTGLVYKIDHEVISPLWKKIYQYGVDFQGDDIKYSLAQASFWLLRDGRTLEHSTLYTVIYDILLNKNCENYLMGAGASSSEASSSCSANREKIDSTQQIKQSLSIAYLISGGSSAYTTFETKLSNDINAAISHFESYSKEYNGKLYYWIEENGNTNRQAMLAPLLCGDNNYSCVDKNGKVHDYTDEYNVCVRAGGGQSDCRAQFENKYCSNSTTGVIKTTGSNAVCVNNFTNYGSYNEYVDTTVNGNAIDGIGEPEKQITQYCNLFCLENSAQQIFPGNVTPAVSTGTYIIWPTSEATLSSSYKNQYPLKFSGEKTCYVVMAGEDNTVNKTDINGVLTRLNSDATNSNNYDSEFAKQRYEISRLNGGCENVYSNTSGKCKNSYDAMMAAKRELDAHTSSQVYQNALREQQEINAHNSNLCSHDTASHLAGGIPCTGNYCTEKDYFCNKNSEWYSENSCNVVNQQCAQQNESGCTPGNTKALSQASRDAIAKYNELNSKYNEKKTVYDRCAAQRSACNDYTNKVQAMVNFANEVKNCATYTPSCSGESCDMYNFETNVDLSWGDAEYGTTIYDSQLEKTKKYSYSINGNSNVSVVVDMSQGRADINTNASRMIKEVSNIVKNRSIKASVSVTYSLPTSGNLLYNYVVKRNNRFVSQTAKPSSDSNYTTIGFSNLPISFDAKSGQDYSLTLSNIKFGDNGGQYNPSNYTCNYEVTKTPSSECLCPVGTKHEGKDLSSFVIDKGLTCYDAQKTYCDYQSQTCPDDTSIDLTACISEYDYFTCYDKYCRNDGKDKYCPNKPEIKLTTCLNNYSYDYCYNLLCTSNVGSEYKCKNTNGVDGEMDITSCVYTKMSQGLSLNDAINECDALICPISGLRIIYRTISLENPFPGKNISNMVNGFNDDVKGRYPGTNWNDVKLVNEHILTVKRQGIKYDGSSIYQGEPLYTFVLTTSTINAIRNYNERQELNGGYADYTLDCKLNNSRACVSDFVHNPDLSGLVSGVCMNSTSRSNFYVCSGDN